LLIDDDRDILVAARRLLMRTVDLEVFGAVSDAVTRLEAGASAVALVLCDLMMPDGGAATLVPLVEERWPHLASRIYILTGGAVSPQAVTFVNSHRDRVLDKAVEFPQLVERVAALIQTADAHA
jgi:DNA-binding NarL/FixJ family response regulator